MALLFPVVFTALMTFFLPCTKPTLSPDASKSPKITPKIYSSIFVRRREEHKLFVKHLRTSKYEKTYKMLELGFEKILEIIKENNMTLHQSGFCPSVGFPTESRLQDAVSLIIENVCLGSDLILNFPEISSRVLRKYANWKETFDWGTKFLSNYVHIINEQTYEMIELFRQEVNLSKRLDDFVNPYYTKITESSTLAERTEQKVKKKYRKKLKRGPQLKSGRVEL